MRLSITEALVFWDEKSRIINVLRSMSAENKDVRGISCDEDLIVVVEKKDSGFYLQPTHFVHKTKYGDRANVIAKSLATSSIVKVAITKI